MMGTHLTQLATRLYPRWWRARYGKEFAALLEEAPPGWRSAMDVAKGAMTMQMSTISAKRIWALGALAGLLVGAAVPFLMPEAYRSYAVIELEPTQDYGDLQYAVNKISSQAMSRSVLSRMILQLGLYKNELRKMPIEDVQDLMRRNVRLSMANVATQGRVRAAFSLSFDYPDPKLAQSVVTELMKPYLEAGGEVLDSASLPKEPLFPNVQTVAFTGFLAGFLIGGLVALLVYIRRLQRRVVELTSNPPPTMA